MSSTGSSASSLPCKLQRNRSGAQGESKPIDMPSAVRGGQAPAMSVWAEVGEASRHRR